MPALLPVPGCTGSLAEEEFTGKENRNVRKEIRRIKLPHLHNLRSLGGYETSDGSVTAWGKLYRSDCPELLTDAEWETIRNLGIRTLVDLRSTFEARKMPVCPPEAFTYVHCPFFYEDPGISPEADAERKFLSSLSIDYCVMTEKNAAQVARILTAILEGAGTGAVMFFCTAGKDRTGIVSAEILRLCGVSDADIIADYSVTQIYNHEMIRQRISNLPPSILKEVPPETMTAAADSNPAVMRRYLDWSKEWGFPEQMDRLGFSLSQQDGLKQIMEA